MVHFLLTTGWIHSVRREDSDEGGSLHKCTQTTADTVPFIDLWPGKEIVNKDMKGLELKLETKAFKKIKNKLTKESFGL